MKFRGDAGGFALPTVVITSLILMMMLMVGLSMAYGTRTALDEQYYDQLAREASEAGVVFAQSCLESNGYVAKWSGIKPLKPGTDCSGNVLTSPSYVYADSKMQITFSVGVPVVVNGSQTLVSNGSVNLLRASNSTVWKSYPTTVTARYGAETTPANVAFGYNDNGSFFGTIGIDGTVKTTGNNSFGQLGNGTATNSLVPTTMLTNPAVRVTKLFSSLLSGGADLFYIDENGDVYGAGANAAGQLGNGTTTNPITTPVKYNLPGGRKGRSITTLLQNSYVVTTDNNIYSAGLCVNGILGSGAAIAGCSNVSTPVRVALPTPTTSDLNTLPTDMMTADRYTIYVLMQGGRVYGWGDNVYGLLGTPPGTLAQTSTPQKIGTFGDAGSSKAVHISTDGQTTYITDDAGQVWSMGANQWGQAATMGQNIINVGSNKCLNNMYLNLTGLWLYACSPGDAASMFTFRRDGLIELAGYNVCVDNPNGNGVAVGLVACNPSAPNQKFVVNSGPGMQAVLYNLGLGKCLDNVSSNGTDLQFYPCNYSGAQSFNLENNTGKISRAFFLPATEKVVKTSTDFNFVAALTENGNVWMAGYNPCGNFGNGNYAFYSPGPTKFPLPAGVIAKDVYATYMGADMYTANVFVVGSDGKVYGAGGNRYGQLGQGSFYDCEPNVKAMSVIDGTTIVARQVVAGTGAVVIYAANGRVYTVGKNDSGQLGDGTTNNSATPKANIYTNVIQPSYY